MNKTTAILAFWALTLVLLTLDLTAFDRPRLEPSPIALGSGQRASGGHCSGR